MPQPEPGVPLDSGDARTLQHVYSGGVLWLSAQTAAHVGSADAPLSVAVVYFALLPSWNDTAAVEEEGGTAAAAGGNSVMLSSKQQQHQTQALVPGALSNRHSAAFSPRLVAAGYFAAPGGGLAVEAGHHGRARRHGLGLGPAHGSLDAPHAGRREGRLGGRPVGAARRGAVSGDPGTDGPGQEVQGELLKWERGQRGREQDGDPEGR